VQKYVLSELDSGERVISERLPGVRSVALGFWIGAGSRDETDAKAGVSHFLEHLLFKGSRSYTAQQIAESSTLQPRGSTPWSTPVCPTPTCRPRSM
jgi:predicted Zn-dependent peptidase